MKLMKTSTQLSRCCWVRKTNLKATEQSEKFHVRRGSIDHQFRRLFTKICISSCCKKRRAQQSTEAHSMQALFSACRLRDDNVITSKPAWKPKHTNSILESSEYFCKISWKSIHIISSYTVSKLGRFFETQCISQTTRQPGYKLLMVDLSVIKNTKTQSNPQRKPRTVKRWCVHLFAEICPLPVTARPTVEKYLYFLQF